MKEITIKLTVPQKELIEKMRAGFSPHIFCGEYRIGTKQVQMATIQKLADQDVIVLTESGSDLFKLTPLGKSIQI